MTEERIKDIMFDCTGLSKEAFLRIYKREPTVQQIDTAKLRRLITKETGITISKTKLRDYVVKGICNSLSEFVQFIMSELEKEQSISTKSLSNMKSKSYDKNIEYAIGIDLGHGETSVAICPIQWDKEKSQMDPVKDMDMGSNRKVIPSAITIMKNGDAYIGESAFKADRLQNAAESHLCFKQMPKDINGKAEQIMIRFMKEVYRLIRERNQALLSDGNHVVAIATPSGWPTEAMELYKQMAKEAGMPIEFVTKESRAAFVKAQNDATSGLGRNLSKGAIVFDMGSSTLDFTFMNMSNQQTYIDHGYDCGASIVEKTMFKCLETDNPILKDFLIKYPELAATFLYKTREVKEKIYFEPEAKVKTFINFEEMIDDDDDFEDERVKLMYNPGELNELLDREGYIAKIKDAMLDFKSNFIKDATIYGVLLTGGASRMDFIKDLVKQYWNVDDSQIYRDQDPSLTISQGVAEVARADMLTSDNDNFNAEIQALIDSDQIYEDFVVKFGGELYQKTIDAVNVALDNFVQSNQDLSLNSLQFRISNEVSSAIKGSSNLASQYIEKAILDSSKDIRKKVEDIILYYSAGGKTIELPVIKVDNVNINGINMDDVIKDIASQIQKESSGWGAVIAGGAIGAALAFMGPLGWLLGGGALILKSIFGEEETEEQKKKKAMQKKLDANERAKVYQSIGEKSDEICNSIANSIENSLRCNSNIKSSIKKLTREILTEYKVKLQEARIVLD